ncbi:MAG: SpoIIE family protein phosphatase [Bacteroidales bacterium]|nr:SpoIIE family protein phosphatase [Bacteroidales bacterium]
MNKPATGKLIISIFILFFIHSASITPQSFKFKKLGIQQGICHPFVYTINQDRNGFIWIGTGEGLCKFDGFNFYSDNGIDILKKDVVNISYKEEDGDLWFGFQNGAICYYDGKKFALVETLESVKSTITGFSEDEQGRMLVSTMNNGILVIENLAEKKRLLSQPDNKLITALTLKDDLLFTGTQNGLEIYRYQSGDPEIQMYIRIEELNFIKIQVIKPDTDRNEFWIGTEDEGIYLLSLKKDQTYRLNKIGVDKNLGNLNVQSVFKDAGNNVWIGTLRDGVYKFQIPDTAGKINDFVNYDKNNGLTSNSIKNVFEDREGNIWIATYGDGLALFLSDAITFFNYQINGFSNNITSIAVQEDILWLGGREGLLKVRAGSGHAEKIFDTGKGLPGESVTALFYDKARTLWIGTEKSGLYKMDLPSEKISRFSYIANSLGRSINSITGDGNILYAATNEGIYYFNLSTGDRVHYSTINGLPHNVIEHVFIDNENNLLFATQADGIYSIDVFGEIKKRFSTGNYEIDFNSVTQDMNGHIWASTYGAGVCYFGDDTIVNFTTHEGLKSDFAYSIIASDEGSIWVGHRLGITRINIPEFSKYIYDVEKGITGDCNQNSVFRDAGNNLYFGTTEGLIKYDPDKDIKTSIPPQTNIMRIFINDKPFDLSETILLPYARYKIRIEFIGLNYRDPESVRYQYKLDGYDPDWSETTSLNYVIYPRVQDGRYRFMVRSFYRDAYSQTIPEVFNLRIKLPFYKTAWFILLSSLILVLIVILIIKIRERKQKQLQEFLEKSLAERTKEVVEQKEEIEIKNRDITDSINYAQRIQASILPPLKRLQQNFAGAFVFYQPRDIVSGDFYWYDRVADSKFIIVCADSTGHGVPGAFMSMIGTTLIKDICSREDTRSPSDILRSLDLELRNTLNQNVEADKATDGMDIIVCEINLKTNYVRYASAMRPMIVYKDSEEYYIKGSRRSVGGHYDKSEKEFQDEGIQLSHGDLIYMFSDGYPDQFGGPMGKKFKMVRLKNLLEDINKKPMDEQYNHVKNTFNIWKEDYPQVDDVLFMGIKI